ncbi:MAG: glutamate dehydrogenase [Cellvibrionaceae bacterium]|jgi:glutamate dehydrogenase
MKVNWHLLYSELCSKDNVQKYGKNMDMSLVITGDKSEFLEQLHHFIQEKLQQPDADILSIFSDEFFEQYPLSELEGRSLVDIFGLVNDAFEAIGKFSKRPLVRVYSPSIENDCWQCAHSVLLVHCKNMPFLMGSVRMALTNNGIVIHAVNFTSLIVERDKKGILVELTPSANAAHLASDEALLYFEITHLSKTKDLKAVEVAVRDALKDITLVNNGYSDMLNELQVIRDNIDNARKHHKKEEIGEANHFLSWLMVNNFTFLGYAFHEEKPLASETRLAGKIPITSPCVKLLGLLTNETAAACINENVQTYKKAKKKLLTFSKLPIRSSVHRRAYPDHIIIKAYDPKGQSIGEHHIIGLYTFGVYRASVMDIPVLREKIETIYENINTNIGSYNGKVIRQVLETYPRDELFQSNTDELTKTITSVSQISERQLVRLFMRCDSMNNFAYSMVYIPRDVFSTRLREQIITLLSEAVDAESHDFYTYYSESILSRTYVIFRLRSDHKTNWKTEDLELKVKNLARTWSSSLHEALISHCGEAQGIDYYKLYEKSFSSAYQEEFGASQSVKDIKVIEGLSDDNPLALDLCEPLKDSNNRIHFKIFHKGSPLTLSEVIPVLERMNLKVLGEHPYKIKTPKGLVWLHDFELKSRLMAGAEFSELKERFENAFENIWSYKAENDGFNGLVLLANIHWREVVVLRAYAAYMKQTLFPFSKRSITKTLMAYPGITRKLVSLFHTLFDPAFNPTIDKGAPHNINKVILADLDEVSNLNDDRILRRYLDFINGTLRTNFYQFDESGDHKEYVSFKFNPREISGIPEPRPQYEIFVNSPRVEGVHLRGGKVARGGLRWSDRHEDFRTEVLGLVKTQQVKNAVIVPDGAKGGFISKKASMAKGRESFLNEGIACYKTFISGLLDITDNLLKGKVIPPINVVRRDEDDTYLVVAADKGTATFSDIANEISKQYNHWLGDAFASGGSQGYDHKGMGITARGAWVSVQRHFKEKGINVQKEEFTVVGVGDMAGDVFGNGMLMSEHICLTAAFNHLHIFIDPKPNAAASFKERQRLFSTPGTSWEDYNKKLISKGGGVFGRNEKSISLSAEMKASFDIHADKLTPTELISALLKSPVDLIWNGGIGTYVKSASESHIDIGDKANDGLRVNGAELRCKVFGEGGNLGLSQKGRIEFAMHGGACNTDFIDNAAGVDCSDHEVNIKILLNKEVNKKRLTEKQRNRLLVSMTDTVAQMVLENNYYQTQSISLAEQESLTRINEYRRLINTLESSGRLNRALEFIPSDEELSDRAADGESLTRPELAVLNSYVKVQLKEELAVDEIADNPYLSSWVEKAFPKQLLKKYKKQIHSHILRKEIIATQLANDMVDNIGITFCHRLVEATGETPAQVAMAYVIARDVFQFDNFKEKVEFLDYKVPASDQLALLLSMMRRVRRGTRWFLRNRRGTLNPVNDVAIFEPQVAEAIKATPAVLSETEKQKWEDKRQYFYKLGLSNEWANVMSMPGHLFSGLGVAEAAIESKTSIARAVEIHHLLGDKLGLYWFAHAVTDVHVENHWQAMARESFIDEIDKVLRVMSVNLLRLAGDEYQLEESLQLWMHENPQMVSRWRTIAHDLQTNTATEFAMFSVAMRGLIDLMEACRDCKKLQFG